MTLNTCLILSVVALLLWFVFEGCFVVPNLCREWRKARRK